MTVIISHETAIACWKSGLFDHLLRNDQFALPPLRPAGYTDVSRVASLSALSRLDIAYGESFAFGADGNATPRTACPSSSEIHQLKQGNFAFAPEPLHVLVPRAGSRGSVEGVVYHAQTTRLPPGSLVRMDENTLIASPEMAFAQMATSLPPHLLAKLGYELCATYAMFPNSTALYGKPVPPTATQALMTYLTRAKGLPGATAALRALRYVADASGSPMETVLALRFCLPSRLGGYGLPLPKMNYRIDPQRNRKLSTGRRYYLCDLFWPEAGLCVEYDSDSEHTGPERIARDARRRNDLTDLGVTVIVATNQQVSSTKGFDVLAQQVAKALGRRIRKDRVRPERRREALFHSLVHS